MDEKSQPVSGIEGYRELNNQYYELHFKVEIPSNWKLDEYELESQTGHWISLQGPPNFSKMRVTGLDFYLIEQGTDSVYESLDAYIEYSVEQESIGESQILLDRSQTVGGVTGREIKIISERAHHTPSGPVQFMVIKQWTTLFLGNHIVQVFYESPQEDFDNYFEVYQHALETIVFRE